MKYIDAERLKAEIKKHIKEVKDAAKRFTPNLGFFDAKLSGIYDVMAIIDSLQQEQPDIDDIKREWYNKGYLKGRKESNIPARELGLPKSCDMQEQPEVDLEKFTQKMNDWKARYNYPDNIPIKAAMAFTARMFYQYPNVARQWYDSLPKATMD